MVRRVATGTTGYGSCGRGVARCLEAVASRAVDAASCVVPVPRDMGTAVARGYLDLKYPAASG